jgi:hypothetical protein
LTNSWFSRRQTAGSPGDKQLVLQETISLFSALTNSWFSDLTNSWFSRRQTAGSPGDKQLVLQETNSWFSRRQAAGSPRDKQLVLQETNSWFSKEKDGLPLAPRPRIRTRLKRVVVLHRDVIESPVVDARGAGSCPASPQRRVLHWRERTKDV